MGAGHVPGLTLPTAFCEVAGRSDLHRDTPARRGAAPVSPFSPLGCPAAAAGRQVTFIE